MAKISKEEWDSRINEAGNGRYEFVRWVVDDKFGSNHKCAVRCVKDLNEWIATPNNLIDKGSGCPQCAGVRRWTEYDRINQINEIKNIKFVSWVDGYNGKDSKANVRCMTDGFEWSVSVNNIVNGGKRCPHCAGNRMWTSEERIEQINSLESIEFVSWFDDYKNNNSKANVRCEIDGFEWSATVNSLVNDGNGCPQCAGLRRWTSEERIEQINKLENIEFVSWVNVYKGVSSKANVRCSKDGFVWESTINNIVNNGHGCPRCAKYGYQLDRKGYLYALRSGCGKYVKVGISNDPKRRHKVLEIKTPFKFNLVEQLEGDGTKIAELEKYFHNKYESAGFKSFDGATEWLVCTPELLEELRELEDVK